jgi:hypothetical protein
VKLRRSIPLALAVPAVLTAGSHALAAGSGKTISAISKGVGITFVDADRNGRPSLGDYEVGNSVYVNRTSGKVIGRGSVTCTQTDPAGGSYQCQGVAHFAGGDVVTAGRFAPASKTGSHAILGGTGVYEGVTGVLAITWLDPTFARASVVFRFRSG